MAEFKDIVAPVEGSSNPDSWGISRMNVLTLNYRWKIENFRYWDEKSDNFIGSPHFYIEKLPDTKWQMRLYLSRGQTSIHGSTGPTSTAVLRLVLVSSKESSVKAKYKFTFLNDEGVMLEEEKVTGFHIFKKGFNLTTSNNHHLVHDTSAWSNNVTIICEINLCKGSVYIQPIINPPDSQKEFEKNRQNDFEDLLNSGRLSDITLKLNNNVKIRAHKAILAARSSVFAEMFEAQLRDSMQTYDVSVVEVEEPIMRELLRYVYADRVENIDEIAFELLQAANQYRIEGLKKLCVSALSDKINGNNAFDILDLAKALDLESLKKKAISVLAMKKGNPLVWLDAEDVVCSDSPDDGGTGTVQRVKRMVKNQILDRLIFPK